MFNQFLSGALFFGFLVSAMFFIRFWRKTADRLFLIFAVAFLLLGVERVVISFIPVQDEFLFCIYGIRLSAFLLLILAIVDKNRR